MKQSSIVDKNLLKKSSLDITLLPEHDDDKRVAALLSKRLDPTRSITENSALIRKNIIASSSLPSSFNLIKEKKAMKVLSSQANKDIGIRPISKTAELNVEPENKKLKTVSSLVEYGSSSDTD